MAKKNDDDLDRYSRKRLEQLNDDWNAPISSWRHGRLSAADLRLMLKHHEPLRDLIRDIVVMSGGAASWPLERGASTQPARADANEAGDCPTGSGHRQLQSALAEAIAARDEAQARCHKLEEELAGYRSVTQQLQQSEARLKKDLQQAKNELNDYQAKLNDCEAKLKRSTAASPELALLRSDVDLARRLDLANLPEDDTQALIQVVALLAQGDNLERLWDALKERCEAQRRGASADERGLLAAALAWRNHNWRSRPFRLVEAEPGSPYDYEGHLRSRQTDSGERVIEARLPGIADGSGKLLRKPLVVTG